MTKEQGNLSYEWWIKLQPLVNKFKRETKLRGLDRDDIEQECYILLQQAWEKYDARLGVPFESYYKIYIYGWRSNQNQKKRELLGKEEMFITIDERINIEQEIEKKLLLEKALGELQKLTDTEKEIIISYYIHHQKLKDIAIRLGLNYKTAEFKKGAALKKIRNRLK